MTLPPWPAASLAEIEARLCAPGEPFEMVTETVRGGPIRTWKNAPVNTAAIVTASRSYGERLATIYERERISFEAQYRAIATLAAALAARGIVKGDRVAIAMANLPEWPVAFFAITIIGAIAVPLNAWWTGGELAYGLEDSGAKLLIADEQRWQRIAPLMADVPELSHVFLTRTIGPVASAEALAEIIGTTEEWSRLPDTPLPDATVLPDDDATIFYTSGTTGRPKGAIGTHRNIMTNVMSAGYVAARTIFRRGEDLPTPVHRTALLVIPLFHVTACSAGLMIAVAAGNTTIYMRRWDALEALAIIERERVNITGGVPTIAWQLLEHPERARFDLSSLESIGYGGAPAAPELVRRIKEEFGAMPASGWGMTETMATVTSHAAEDYLARPESCGAAVPVADLRIVSADGSDAATGEVGELWARGPQVVRGYWQQPEATAATFVDGWVRTGDLARLDGEGFCYIVDRIRDMVIRGGENIYSSEVENALYAYPGVVDAAVIGLPHRTLGEEPAAVVHMAAEVCVTEAELQTWVRARLAAFKAPVRIIFLPDTLPRNANGKILKNSLRPLFD